VPGSRHDGILSDVEYVQGKILHLKAFVL